LLICFHTERAAQCLPEEFQGSRVYLFSFHTSL
jgi:hypothetical protein